MTKKRRRRKTNPHRITKADFKEDVINAYSRMVREAENMKYVDPRSVAEYAEVFAPWAQEQNLNLETFLLTEWGEIALESVRECIEKLVGVAGDIENDGSVEDAVKELIELNPDEVDRKDVTTPEALLYRHAKNAVSEGRRAFEALKPEVEAAYLGRAASLWEMILMFANTQKIREQPYENEHLFHFLSTATFRYQFIYRALEKWHKDDPLHRHIVCRMLPASLKSQADIDNEKITAHIMSELWVSGVNEFEISGGLRDRFMLTDVNNVSADSVRFPYTAFLLQTPEESLMFTTVDHVEADVRVWCVYNQERGVVQLRQDLDKEDTLGDLWNRLPDGFWDEAPESETPCKEAFQLICNLMLYLQCKDAEVHTRRVSVGDKPPERQVRKLRTYARREYTPINHVLYPSLGKEKSAGSTGSRREHWVRGHYRWQAYWPDGRDNDPTHERIWIEPHLRGSAERGEDARDLSSRKYKV